MAKPNTEEQLPINFKYDIKHLEIIPKRVVSSMLVGNYKSIFRGRGMEFEDFRPYVYGDDSRLIDWKASLKAGEILIKEFVEERNLNVFFMLDVSSKMCAGSIEKFKNEYSAEFVASITYAITQVGDAVGLGMFNDGVVNILQPNTGPRQYYMVRKELANPKNYGGGCNLSKALRYFDQYLERGTMVIIVSDFIDLLKDEELPSLLKVAAQKYDLIGAMVRDIRDRQLPRGVGNVLISDPETGKEVVIDPDKIGDEYENFVKAEEESIRSMFLRSNADMVLFETSKPFMYPLLKFFKKRSEKFH